MNKNELKKKCSNNFNYLIDMYPRIELQSGMISNDELIFLNAYVRGETRDATNVVPIYSLTKWFTALAFFRSVREGKIELSNKLTEYLPDLRLYCGGKQCSNNITFTHLLSHTSGLQHEAAIGNNFQGHHSLKEHIDSINENRLLFVPGTSYSYSNLGYDLVGFVLCQLYQMNFEELIRKLVFDPMNIKQISFAQNNISQNPSMGIHTSISDLLKCMRLSLFGFCKPYFFSEETFHLAQSIQAVRPGQLSGYGLGTKILKIADKQICLLTGNYLDCYLSMMWSPKDKLGYVITVQKGFNENILHELNVNDVFSTIVEKGAQTVKCFEYRKPENIKLIDLKMDGSYLAINGEMIYIQYMENQYSISFDGVKWDKMNPTGKFKFWLHEMEIRFDCTTSIKQVIVNGYHSFNTYFANDLKVDLTQATLDPVYKSYCGKYQFFPNGKPLNPKLAFYKEQRIIRTLTQITVCYQKGALYINSNIRLRHCECNVFEKSTGERIVFDSKKLTIGNLTFRLV